MMERNGVSVDRVIAELLDMGFEFSEVTEAIEAVGASLDDAIEFILNGSIKIDLVRNESMPATCSTSQTKSSNKNCLSLNHGQRRRQSSIKDHLQQLDRKTRNSYRSSYGSSFSGSTITSDCKLLYNLSDSSKMELSSKSQHVPEASLDTKKLVSQENGDSMTLDISMLCDFDGEEIESDWKSRAGLLLQKHFGFSSLKKFQIEAMDAWLSNRDCLILAATGSGKSLCFHLPALLTKKIVIVISPLISLMHDQCLKLATHGISACFLGSGQSDNSIEFKAMSGMYKIVYVCPETLLRLIEPLKKLAKYPGIALFAIDEVHCVSKWGHDFRPDYRRLSVLRETFNSTNLKYLKCDIPLMALTATATIPVRKDVIKSLHMSIETRTILTSFFRPNLQFSVKHSRTSHSSYADDFTELIKTYTKENSISRSNHSPHDIKDDWNSQFKSSKVDLSDKEFSVSDDENESDDNANISNYLPATSLKERQLTVEYLENELDIVTNVDDFDVSCGEFPGTASTSEICGESEMSVSREPLEHGSTIIYVPTRKQTVEIAQYLCKCGVRASAYHAKMPKSHLRSVHEKFHKSELEVVVATIAFGMGIDKANVRRIIHYGWPQSLEAYYQEAGRAGRDGKLSHCTLYANLSRIPTLLPSQRSEECTRQAYKMLSDCFRYAMNTSTCRAKTLVRYFGEELAHENCNLCDICKNGPPEIQNLKEEVDIFMQVLTAESEYESSKTEKSNFKSLERSNFKMIISRIREQFPKFAASDHLWWQGLVRTLQNKGYIREGDDMPRVSIRFPEPTELGLRYMQSEAEESYDVYPEADMLLSSQKQRPFSSFSEWGRGWADPEIRRQRLQGSKGRTRKRRQSRKRQRDPIPNTVRGRLTAKLSKYKH